ncbi:amino acid adenylation domain-containing protein [Streptomyces sp. NPDC089799]|uniref:amino acid adenylation domain-containing protein n=1 Tax=Streptomyces sp. NPDC089799 TaxID=3155066 RepID=UPI00342B9917
MKSVHRTIHERFAEAARRHPDATALVDEEGPVSYGELQASVDELAGVLAQWCTEDDRLIAARVGRSRSAPLGFLGILAGGRGYVPVDPDHPRARRDLLLDDSAARLVLTDGPPEADETPLAEVAGLTLASRRVRPHRSGTDIPERTAYVIYTSGSTGTPKGCVVGHDQVLALLDACAEVFDLRPRDVWTVAHSFGFDFSVWELWGALLNGGTALIVPSDTARDPEAFAALLASREVTVLSQTPSMFGFLVGTLSRHGRSLSHLRHAVLGGEPVNLRDALAWLEGACAPRARLVNMYGITETTVHVTYGELDADTCRAAEAGRTPIGRPLPHLRISLRDAAGQPVADGEPGEMWVAGSGVAHGYLRRPDLTAERFVTEPSGDRSTRHYRSGDWAVRGTDGTLHYVGRTDSQVKVRGHRVELGEVEAVLTTLDGVRGAACVVQTNRTGQHILVAYIVDDASAGLNPGRIRAHLADRIPAHMRPHRFKRVEAIPVTANGKLDRAALPALAVLDWSAVPTGAA